MTVESFSLPFSLNCWQKTFAHFSRVSASNSLSLIHGTACGTAGLIAGDKRLQAIVGAEKNSDRWNKNRSVLAGKVFAKSATAGHYCSRL
jgi:hypothetical protein